MAAICRTEVDRRHHQRFEAAMDLSEDEDALLVLRAGFTVLIFRLYPERPGRFFTLSEIIFVSCITCWLNSACSAMSR